MNLTPQPIEARELSGRELTRALRENFAQVFGADFEDTVPAWMIEPTTAQTIRAKLREEYASGFDSPNGD